MSDSIKGRFCAGRRSVLAGLAGASAAVALGGGRAAAKARPFAGLIIDNLGGIGDPNPKKDAPETPDPFAADDAPLSERGLRDALASGLTAFNLTLGYVAGAADPFERSVDDIAHWDGLIRANSKKLLKVFTADDILEARKSHRIGVIYGFQNALQLGDDLRRVDVFANLGVKVIQLTYNNCYPIGCGAAMAAQDTGLSHFGRQTIARLEEKRVLVDLSHGGTKTIDDALAAATRPLAISHTGCRALADLPRNVSDEALRRLADKGGVAGIYFMPFLKVGAQPMAEDVVRHIEHAVNVAGENHVGIGCDNPVTQIDDMPAYYEATRKEVAERAKRGVSAPGESGDIVPLIPDLQGTEKYRKLAAMLAARGHSNARIEKIMGRNWLRLFGEVWG
ncbi:MAG: peptidase M19 [Alphaproteobacteria bacterium]|nr:peptidase M19 [Alphaproteobacteria bacterium]